MLGKEKLTIDPSLDSFLNRQLENLSLSPDLHNPPQLLLHLVRGALICAGRSFSDDGGKGDQEVVLTTGLRLLCDFCDAR